MTFEIFGKIISMYQILSLAGLFTAGILASFVCRQRRIVSDDMIVFMLIMGIGILFGGHILYGIINMELLIDLFKNLGNIQSFNDLMNRAVVVFGGSVFYGGLLGGCFAAYIYTKKKRLNLFEYADIMAPCAALFHVFGRIGCFLGGCCYGVESHFGFMYENHLIPEASGVVRFPVQLLEAFFNLILFLVLFFMFKRKLFYKNLFYIYLLLYATGRFFIEFLRGDDNRGFLFGFSTSQIISVLILFYLIIIFVKSKIFKLKNKS